MGKKASWLKIKEQQISSMLKSWIRKENAWGETGPGRREFYVRVKNWPDGKVLQLSHTQHEIRLRNIGSKN
jgi:hypothetical protein